MSAVCPAGHTSAADDYCDVCGMPIDATAVTPGSPPPARPPNRAPSTAPAGGTPLTGQTCPNCGTANVPDALFCENCGYDFTTGTMPRPLAPPASRRPTPPADAVPPDRRTGRRAAGRRRAPERTSTGWPRCGSTRPGTRRRRARTRCPPPACRTSCRCAAARCWSGGPRAAATSTPTIDCETDSGVSRRQAQLTTDGTRWWVEDLESANGTFVGPGQRRAARGPDPGRGQAGAGRRRPGLPRRLDPAGDPAGHRRRARHASARRPPSAHAVLANTVRFGAGCGTVAGDRHAAATSQEEAVEIKVGIQHVSREIVVESTEIGHGHREGLRHRAGRRQRSSALTDAHGRKVLIPASQDRLRRPRRGERPPRRLRHVCLSSRSRRCAHADSRRARSQALAATVRPAGRGGPSGGCGSRPGG